MRLLPSAISNAGGIERTDKGEEAPGVCPQSRPLRFHTVVQNHQGPHKKFLHTKRNVYCFSSTANFPTLGTKRKQTEKM